MSNIHRCGFCGVLTGLLRRVMCVGGSSESCYRELDEQDTLERERNERDYSTSSSDEWDSSDYHIPQEPPDENPLAFSTLKRQKKKGYDLTGPLLDDHYPMKVQLLLSMCSTWEFDTQSLDRATGGHSLSVLCMHLFTTYGLIEHFKLLPDRCWKLFRSIEDHYHSRNPYHNSIHAADVTQAIHCFLQQKPIRNAMSKMEVMMALLAAIVHDLDHPGVNQSFLVATNHPLAVMRQREIYLEENNPNTYTSRRGTKSLKLQQQIYDLKVAKQEDPDADTSPFKPKNMKKVKKKEIPAPESILELHHWRIAYCCIVESGIFEHMAALMPGMKCMLKSLIMATDITRQNFYLDEFKKRLENKDLDMEIPDHRHIVLQMALKTADISNPGRPWNISKKWSSSVCEEFYRQGDEELKRNIKVSNLCNRKTDSIPKIQSGFYRYVVMPLYTEWNHFLNSKLSMTMLKNLIRNESKWANEGRKSSYTDPTSEFISDADMVENELETSTNISGSPDLLMTWSMSQCSFKSGLRLPRRGSYSPIKHHKLQEMLRRYSAPLHTFRESRARCRAKKMSVPECRLRKDVLKMAATAPAATDPAATAPAATAPAATAPAATAPAANAPAATAPAAATVEADVSTEKTRDIPEAGPSADSVPLATSMSFGFILRVDSDDDESTLTEERESRKIVSVIVEESSISSSSRFPSNAPSCSGANGYSADCSSSIHGLIPSLSSARTSSAPCSESHLDRYLEEDIPIPKLVVSSYELGTYTAEKVKEEEMKEVKEVKDVPRISNLYQRRRGSAPVPLVISDLNRPASTRSLQVGRKNHNALCRYKVCLLDDEVATSAAEDGSPQ